MILLFANLFTITLFRVLSYMSTTDITVFSNGFYDAQNDCSNIIFYSVNEFQITEYQ